VLWQDLAHVEIALRHRGPQVLNFNTNVLIIVVLFTALQIFSYHRHRLHSVCAVGVRVRGDI